LKTSVYNKRYYVLAVLLFHMQAGAFSQAKSGVENYNTLRSHQPFEWMIIAHHMNKRSLYYELRYNYEAPGSGSVYVGKNFTGGKKIKYAATPMLGIVVGKYNGASVGLNMELNYKKISGSSQAQYTASKDNSAENFYYNWSELSWQPLEWMYAGISLQQTKQYKNSFISEAGILLGFEIKNITIPLYIFSPLSYKRNFIIGVNIEW
jgi:hypothetical protein